MHTEAHLVYALQLETTELQIRYSLKDNSAIIIVVSQGKTYCGLSSELPVGQ